jgi:hypothetical protein
VSNFNTEPPVETSPDSICPSSTLAGLAIEAAMIEAKSRRLQALRDLGQYVEVDSIRNLDETWLELNSQVRTLVVKNPELEPLYQAAYTSSLIEGFQRAREEFTTSSSK